MFNLKHTFICSATALGLLSLGACSQQGFPSGQPPNIVFILADDLGYGDLGVYGQTKFKTPNIDRLAQEGIRFTQHYSGSTVCAPSRSVLLTGLHTGQTPVRGNKEFQPEGQQPLPEGTRTIAHLLSEAGYTNGLVGKWGLGYPGSGSEPLDMGFDYFFGQNCQRHAHHYFVDYLLENRQKLFYEKKIYSHDEITRQGLAFIHQNREKPFFLYMAYAIPHAELVLPQEYLEPFKGLYPESRPWPAGQHYGAQPFPRAALAAMISHLDADVGKVMNLLKELGLDENTLVIFTSDNGPAVEGGNDPAFFNSSGGLRGVKRDLYEGGIRVPMIARMPAKIPSGKVSGHISAFWDFFPTLAELAGLEAPKNINGISLLPSLTGKGEQAEHPFLYWEFHELGGRQAARYRKWKGVKYDLSSGNAPLELYDLENDPAETHDLAGWFPDVVSEMERIFSEARQPSPAFPFPADPLDQ
ncbi:MAG: arylsulfatase [Bacteroidales bacterium]|jgi:arylsulfatase A-like enzyme|nr:arylsulfatase [Bacteroidales bacterium]NLM93925.1 arylsulfatase [Bacteroidales bacterium]